MSYNNDRIVAKLWEVIGWLRYSPAVGSTAQKCELELRRIVADMQTELKVEREHRIIGTDLMPYEEPARTGEQP